MHLSACTTLSATCCNRLAIFIHPSVRPNPSVLNGKCRLRESRHKRIVVMLSSAQCGSGVQLRVTLKTWDGLGTRLLGMSQQL